jgi:hypothetical protein
VKGTGKWDRHIFHLDCADIILVENLMSKVEQIEGAVKELSNDELSAFRAWFANFDADAWDRQFEADVHDGKLDGLAERALRDHSSGRSTEL